MEMARSDEGQNLAIDMVMYQDMVSKAMDASKECILVM